MADSALPPSRFGAGYTAGSAARVPSADAFAPAPRLNRLAVVTLAAALVLGLVVAPLTFPLSYLAHRQIQESGQGGAGLARAAMIISGVYLVLGAVVIGLYFYLTGADAVR